MYFFCTATNDSDESKVSYKKRIQTNKRAILTKCDSLDDAMAYACMKNKRSVSSKSVSLKILIVQFRPRGMESTKVQITQNKEKERENSYQKLKISL